MPYTDSGQRMPRKRVVACERRWWRGRASAPIAVRGEERERAEHVEVGLDPATREVDQESADQSICPIATITLAWRARWAGAARAGLETPEYGSFPRKTAGVQHVDEGALRIRYPSHAYGDHTSAMTMAKIHCATIRNANTRSVWTHRRRWSSRDEGLDPGVGRSDRVAVGRRRGHRRGRLRHDAAAV